MITTRVRLSWWCPSWELFWVIVTFATAAVKTPHQVYACRFLVGFAEGTFYPVRHVVTSIYQIKGVQIFCRLEEHHQYQTPVAGQGRLYTHQKAQCFSDQLAHPLRATNTYALFGQSRVSEKYRAF